jgi:hypothetical protein
MIGHLISPVAQRGTWGALLSAEIQPYLIDRDRFQPGVKGTALALKLSEVLVNRPEDLLHGIGGIAVLETGPAAPGINDRPVQGAQSLPGVRLRSTGTLQ